MSYERILAGIRYANRGCENGLEHAVLSQQMLPLLRHPVSIRQNGQKWLKLWSTAGYLSRLWRQCGLELCDRLLWFGKRTGYFRDGGARFGGRKCPPGNRSYRAN